MFTTEGHETIKELRHEGDDLDDDKESPTSHHDIDKINMETTFMIEK